MTGIVSLRSLAGLAFASWALASCSSAPPETGEEPELYVSSEGYTLPPALDIPNFHPYSERVAGGGHPSPDALAEAKELGYSAVINLQTMRESGVAEEAGIAEELGLYYAHIPIDSTRVGLKEAHAISKALKHAPEGRVLLHCKSGGRAGAMWGLVEALEAGLSPAEAVAAAQRANLRSERYMGLVHDAVDEAVRH